MKSLLFLLLSVLFVGTSTLSAYAAYNQQINIQIEQDEKVKISNEELPEAVKTALQSESYKDWTISAAYYTKSTEQYEVELKKGEETKTVKLDKDGKVIE